MLSSNWIVVTFIQTLLFLWGNPFFSLGHPLLVLNSRHFCFIGFLFCFCDLRLWDWKSMESSFSLWFSSFPCLITEGLLMMAATPVRSWRTAFLTLRDETLTFPTRTSLYSLLQNLIFSHSDSLIVAVPDLPSHEV